MVCKGEVLDVERFKYSDTMTFFSVLVFEDDTRAQHKFGCTEAEFDTLSKSIGKKGLFQVTTNRKTDKCELKGFNLGGATAN